MKAIKLLKHRKYHFPWEDDSYMTDNFSSWDEMRDQMIKDGYSVVLDVWMFEHDGCSYIATLPSEKPGYPFNCRFDAGQLGLIACKQEKGVSFEEMVDFLKEEIEIYNEEEELA